MYHFYADDGRILTPPQELASLLRGSFPAFSKLLGHIRFFYMADEIWDGKSSLMFKYGNEELAAIALEDGFFIVRIGEGNCQVTGDLTLGIVYENLQATVPDGLRRPTGQLTLSLNDPNQYTCGRRCDLCLGSRSSDENNYSQNENFGYMNWVCYHNCVPNANVDRWDGVFNCPGCVATRKTDACKFFSCLAEKGCSSCAECGRFHSCEIFSSYCHYPGQCNLGLTAGEVTSLVIPYAQRERLDMAGSAND